MSKVTVVSVLLLFAFVLADVNAKLRTRYALVDVRAKIVSDLIAPASRLVSVNYDRQYDPAIFGLEKIFGGGSNDNKKDDSPSSSEKEDASPKKDDSSSKNEDSSAEKNDSAPKKDDASSEEGNGSEQ